jgi:hypothetical protein
MMSRQSDVIDDAKVNVVGRYLDLGSVWQNVTERRSRRQVDRVGARAHWNKRHSGPERTGARPDG